MKRVVLFLAGALLVRGQDRVECALHGARAVDDLLDSATYIWASVQRCQKPTGSNTGTSNDILCTMDVSSAIESANAMVNALMRGIEQCGELNAANAKCGMAAGLLTKTFAGVTASSAGVTAKCPNALNHFSPLRYTVKSHLGGKISRGSTPLADAAREASFAECLVNVKDLTKSLMKATKRLITVTDNCDGSRVHTRDCAHNVLKIIASFAAMGEYLAGAVARCNINTAATDKLVQNSECASEVMSLIRHIHRMGSASIDLNKDCSSGEERLYSIEHGLELETKSHPGFTSVILGALLPLTAVLGFLGGSRYATARRDTQFEMVSGE